LWKTQRSYGRIVVNGIPLTYTQEGFLNKVNLREPAHGTPSIDGNELEGLYSHAADTELLSKPWEGGKKSEGYFLYRDKGQRL